MNNFDVRIGDLENQLKDIQNQRDSSSIQARLNQLQGMIEVLSNKITDLEGLLDKMLTEDCYIETFTTEEIADLYSRSGLTMNDVKAFLENVLGEIVSMQVVSEYVYGQKNDIRVRSRLGKHLRIKAARHA